MDRKPIKSQRTVQTVFEIEAKSKDQYSKFVKYRVTAQYYNFKY